MRNTRRPILLIAIGSWLIAGMYLTGNLVWLSPLVILLTFREKKTWLLGLILLRLVLLPQTPITIYHGPAQISPIDFSKENQWQVVVEGQKFLYQGSLLGPGDYLIEGETRAFRKVRSYTGFSEFDHYRSQGFLARMDIENSKLKSRKKESWTFRLQNKLYDHLVGYGESQNLAFALLFGGSRLLDESLQTSLREVGLLHLMVVSGLHLQIYDRSIDRLLKRIQVPRLARRFLIVGLMILLVFVTNFHPSCIRSVGLSGLREGLFYRRKTIDRLDQLAIITWLMLLWNPYWATATGFLLGTFAHGSLVLPKKPSILKLYIVMLPFQLLLNGLISPIYLLANLTLAMIMDKALPLLAISLILPFLQVFGRWWLGGLTHLIYRLHKFHFLRLEVMMPSPWVIGVVISFYIGLILRLQEEQATLFWRKYSNRVLAILMIIVILGQLGHVRSQRGVHFLDVGQGDAAIIITEDQRSILIDTSKSPKLFDHLCYVGLRTVDVLIVSHRDDDHSYWVDELDFETGYTSNHTPLSGFYPLSQGNELTIDDVTIEVLHPNEKQSTENDNSLVLRVTTRDLTCLFTGDVGKDLLRNEWFHGVDVFKFPHHGSIHSLEPSLDIQSSIPLVILSYGYNRYDHPHPEVVEYFSNNMIHETYFDGSIHLKSRHFRRH